MSIDEGMRRLAKALRRSSVEVAGVIVDAGEDIFFWGEDAAGGAVGDGEEVHVFQMRTELVAERVEYFCGLLSEEERVRMERLRIEVKRRQATVARGFLREMLGRCLNVSPRELRFGFGAYGKPHLEAVGDACAVF